MDELTQLAIKYGTDKWGKHHYTPVYYDLFKDRQNEVQKVLEIGTAEGAGLFMFRDFFPNAIIYGAEIDPRRVELMKGQDRIEVFEVNQASGDDLINLMNEIGGDIDLVIDDGSHKPEDQIFTCLYLMQYVKKGCIYVIEDVADTDIISILANKFYVEVKEVGERYDDRLVIIKK